MEQGLGTVQFLPTCCSLGLDPVAVITLLTRVVKRSGNLQHKSGKPIPRSHTNFSLNPVSATY